MSKKSMLLLLAFLMALWLNRRMILLKRRAVK